MGVLITGSLAIAAAALTRYPLANGISNAKAERTTDQKGNHYIRHWPSTLSSKPLCQSDEGCRNLSKVQEDKISLKTGGGAIKFPLTSAR
jgi:hypothetical protein